MHDPAEAVRTRTPDFAILELRILTAIRSPDANIIVGPANDHWLGGSDV
jgi:hypothetical protein